MAVVPLSLSFVNGRAGAETEERRAGTVRRGSRCVGVVVVRAAAAANFRRGDGAVAKEAVDEQHDVDEDAVACEQALIASKWSRRRG